MGNSEFWVKLIVILDIYIHNAYSVSKQKHEIKIVVCMSMEHKEEVRAGFLRT